MKASSSVFQSKPLNSSASALSANDWKAYDVVKTGYLPNFAMGHQVMMINGQELAKLPADLRDILMKKSEEWSAYMEMVKVGDDEAQKVLSSKGVKLVTPSAEDLAAPKPGARCVPCGTSGRRNHGETGRSLLEKATAACAAK